VSRIAEAPISDLLPLDDGMRPTLRKQAWEAALPQVLSLDWRPIPGLAHRRTGPGTSDKKGKHRNQRLQTAAFGSGGFSSFSSCISSSDSDIIKACDSADIKTSTPKPVSHRRPAPWPLCDDRSFVQRQVPKPSNLPQPSRSLEELSQGRRSADSSVGRRSMRP